MLLFFQLAGLAENKGGCGINTDVKELHLISNGKMPMGQLADILTAIHPFVTAIHLREKSKTARELYDAMNLFAQKNIPLDKMIINDRVDAAIATGAAGVQLAFHSLEASIVKEYFPALRVGCSIHSFQEGEEAQKGGADFVVFGHIFSTGSKPGLPQRGLSQLGQLAKRLGIPVIAIGGITVENARLAIDAGAKGIAVMSGILEAPDPLSAVHRYQNELNGDGS